MIEIKLEVPTIGVETLFFRPDGVADFPGILFLTDVRGVPAANIAMARRLADKGFAVLLPNVVHRYSKMTVDGVEYEDHDAQQRRFGLVFRELTSDNVVEHGM